MCSELYEIVLKGYNKLLKTPHALAYLDKRGINLASIKKHMIGYGDIEMGEETKTLKGDKILFPVFYKKEVVFITSRNLGSGKKHLHMYGPIKYAFNHNSIFDNYYTIITEGPTDCISLDQRGFSSIGLLGANRITRQILTDLMGKKVFICFDQEPNNIGNKATKRLANKLSLFNIHSYAICLPYNGHKVDINEYFQTHTTQEFTRLMQSAKVIPSEKGNHRPRRGYKGTEDIIEIAREYMEIKQSGSYLKAMCPFHKDSEPSLVFYPNTNTGYCFGCGKYVTVDTLRDFFKNE